MTFLSLLEDIINKQMARISMLENELKALRDELNKAKNFKKNKEES
jgi:hypothetical protein|tara:strand:+ start:275 stop:412 length:138 start_codon:yes stop_codon:yes gene_type:complete